MPAHTQTATDLTHAAQHIRRRGLWTGEHCFADPGGSDTPSLDPVAALWLAVHDDLPTVFRMQSPTAADRAARMALADRHVAAAIWTLSDRIDCRLVDNADPVERIADWASRSTESEVVGRMVRIAEQLNYPAAA